jgi:hypothetical protein
MVHSVRVSFVEIHKVGRARLGGAGWRCRQAGKAGCICRQAGRQLR